MSEAQAAQRDDSPMDVDQPSPLDQDPAPLGISPQRFYYIDCFAIEVICK